jgi:hypothetical protein
MNHKMPRTTRVCDKCRGLDLSHAILRSGLSEPDLGQMSRNSKYIWHEEGSCSQCNQLTRLLRISFDDVKTESLSSFCRLAIHSVSHPVLANYKATYFSLGVFGSDLRRYLLPRQACFVDVQSDEHIRLPCTRAVDPSLVDYDMFNDCIKMCQSEHSATCDSTLYRELTPTRLIDCKNRILCAAPNSQYVCLSYVWGDAPADKATSDNTTLADIPQTVSDAMYVTIQLGMRYLWVDRYCIDQNNPQEKHDAIRNMDSIYRNACITIIAAAGSGSNHGLPGVSQPRKPLPSFDIAGHAFAVLKNPMDIVQASMWNSRGWTYQEMLLSRRRLIFTDCQVYFQCQVHERMEQIERDFFPIEVSKAIMKGKQVLPTQAVRFTINDVYTRLEEYYHRTLRYETDNINAFAGVFRELSDRTPCETVPWKTHISGLYMPRLHSHFYGIPLWLQESKLGDDDKTSSYFGLSLGWRIRSWGKVTSSTDGGAVVNTSFPSWSWASTKAQRPKHDPSRMVFFGHPDIFFDIGDADISVSVVHSSGERVSMLAYAAQVDDYTLFHPW